MESSDWSPELISLIPVQNPNLQHSLHSGSKPWKGLENRGYERSETWLGLVLAQKL